jgi:ribosomal protein S18 acetylase RimI-like enzyme
MTKNLTGITVRPASAGDEGFVHDLASEVFSAYSRNARRAIQSILRDRGAETLVAEIDSLRAGFVVLQYERLACDFGPWERPTVARIQAVASRPDLQGRGIGRRLLQSVERGARGRSARSLSLTTGEGNTRARGLFATGGFVELARLERYYAGGQTALLMHRALM